MAFDNFLAMISVKTKRVIGSIQYYYKCQVIGREDRKCRHIPNNEVIILDPNEDPNDNKEEEKPYMEEGLVALKASNRAP